MEVKETKTTKDISSYFIGKLSSEDWNKCLCKIVKTQFLERLAFLLASGYMLLHWNEGMPVKK
jgi:hypothetical protein